MRQNGWVSQSPIDQESLVQSKKRVADHGEVFTPSWMVEDMLNLVKDESERIDSRFLEPAHGSGNFLKPVLQRKRRAVDSHFRIKCTKFRCREPINTNRSVNQTVLSGKLLNWLQNSYSSRGRKLDLKLGFDARREIVGDLCR